MSKPAARKAALMARASAHAAGQGKAAAHLAETLRPHAGKVLAGYLAMRDEIDPMPALLAHHGPVGLPVMEGKGMPLRFRAWHPGAELADGGFGTRIPAAGAWLDPDILIVPMVAFDCRGYRLGYGGGFYDRTLAELRARKPILAIGFAFDAQELAQVPTEPTDQRLDLLVTESGLRSFSI